MPVYFLFSLSLSLSRSLSLSLSLSLAVPVSLAGRPCRPHKSTPLHTWHCTNPLHSAHGRPCRPRKECAQGRISRTRSTHVERVLFSETGTAREREMRKRKNLKRQSPNILAMQRLSLFSLYKEEKGLLRMRTACVCLCIPQAM